MPKTLCICSILLALASPIVADEVVPLADKVANVVQDIQDPQITDREHLSGMLGTRIDRSTTNRLMTADLEEMLAGFRNRPGVQVWCGEHIGKWLHAATLAWVNSGDPKLRARMDYAVDELLKCQLDDGYLGTYLPKDYWTEWDVWVHKYNLIGLLTYTRYTKDERAMPACRKMADLLCKTFGDTDGKRDILNAGHQAGMAPTSVLEPMVWMYRMTGEPRYRAFCEYILRAWEQPNGPHIVSRLLAGEGVNKVGNGKAYEMLSCINGMLEWYRVTGDSKLLKAAQNAWADIVANQLYITGTASYYELFHDNHDLPNMADVGETCVTVTWLQFNAHLLRLTGEAKYAEQLERTAYNQLCGAQRPDGAIWGYYVQMEGIKPYNGATTCCLSSGPRGMAMLSTFALTTDQDGVVVNLYDAGKAALRLHNGTPVEINVTSMYPSDGKITLTLTPEQATSFAVKLRIPEWSQSPDLQINGQSVAIAKGPDGYAAIARSWKKGDTIQLNLKVAPRLVLGDHTNNDKAAICYGPLVLAADKAMNNQLSIHSLRLGSDQIECLAVTPETPPEAYKTWDGAKSFRVNMLLRNTTPIQAFFVPFADAGSTGKCYTLWQWRKTASPIADDENVLWDGIASRSRRGNVPGNIQEGFYVVTFDDQKAAEDWYSITLDKPAVIQEVLFGHGKTFHNGGWFDASAGKPKVQIQRQKDGPWETVGELSDYPQTTATSAAELKYGVFHCQLAKPEQAFGVRVLGKPACGDNPNQAFSSCSSLKALPAGKHTTN